MKKIIILLILTFCLTALAHAKIVHYTDADGKVHYVNTDFAKVPDEYYSQVRAQLEVPKPVQTQDTKSLNSAKPADKKAKPVIFLTSSANCPVCPKLEGELRAKKIFYSRYDVDYNQKGRELHEQIGGELPICLVEEEVIHGDNIQEILNALKRYSREKH